MLLCLPLWLLKLCVLVGQKTISDTGAAIRNKYTHANSGQQDGPLVRATCCLEITETPKVLDILCIVCS
jgi:hypothetical protein